MHENVVPQSLAEVAAKLTELRATTTHFKRTSAGLTPAQLHRPPAPGEWSVNELLAHLRGCADVQGGWIARILAEDTPSISYKSPRTGMKKGNYAALDFDENLAAWTTQRNALIKTLKSLDLAGWSRAATYTGTKPGWTQTVFAAACGLAAHEHAHFAQITAAAQA